MAIWKRLTDSSGNSLDINLDQVAFLRRTGSVTTIHFVGGETDQESSMTVAVKETPDEILKGGCGKSFVATFWFCRRQFYPITFGPYRPAGRPWWLP